MTPDTARQLIALAETATPGPYKIRASSWSKTGTRYEVEAHDGVTFIHCGQYPIGADADANHARHNAEYIAALSPAIVKELVQAHECLRELVRAVDVMPFMSRPATIAFTRAFAAARRLIESGDA